MKKLAFLALLGALGLAACQPAPPPPPPPPPTVDITGRVIEKAGACHTIQGDNGTAYAVRPGVLRTIPRRARVHVVGMVDPSQDCAGRVLLNVSSVSIITGPRRMMRRAPATAPK